MTHVSAAYTRSYNRWVSSDQLCETYAEFVRGLRDRRAEVATEAIRTPEEATVELAVLETQLAVAADVARGLWLKRMKVYQEHRALVERQSRERATEKQEEGNE